MELIAGPERGGSLGTDNRVAYTSVPLSPGESRQCRGRRGSARPRRARPGSSSFTHSHAAPPGSESRRAGFIIGTTFPSSSSSGRTALWSPSVLFWEMSMEQTEEGRALRGPGRKAALLLRGHELRVTQNTEDSTHLAPHVASSPIPGPASSSPPFPHRPSPVITLYP